MKAPTFVASLMIRLEPNSAGHPHWSVARPRKMAAHRDVPIALMQACGHAGYKRIDPATIRLVRCAPRKIRDEGDNLGNAFKWVRDAVAKWFGCDDADKGPLTFKYAQEEEPPLIRAQRLERARAIRKANRDVRLPRKKQPDPVFVRIEVWLRGCE